MDTEDDILHIRDLPTFDGTLGAKDVELLLQYLTAPYIRIPLVLNFFSVESRLKSLRNVEIQEILDAALFEPGMYISSIVCVIYLCDNIYMCYYYILLVLVCIHIYYTCVYYYNIYYVYVNII